MLLEVDEKIWKTEIVSKETTVFDEPEFLKTVSSLYQTKIQYWIIYKKNTSIIGFATHVRRDSIIVPNHYAYSSFWFEKDLYGDFAFFEYLDEAVAQLKKKFRFISFRLPPQISDIRAFNGQGFSATVNYTYEKNLHIEVDYRADLKRKLGKAEKQGFVFSYDQFYEDVISQQMGDFRSFGYRSKQSKFYLQYFQRLISAGFLKSFSIHHEGKLMASSMMVVDFKKKKAYNFLVSASKINYNGDASTYLYHNAFKCLKQLNIDFVDLYGADMKGIACYKAGFKGRLETHYTVTYGIKHKYLTPLIDKIKKNIKSFL